MMKENYYEVSMQSSSHFEDYKQLQKLLLKTSTKPNQKCLNLQ